MIVPQCEPNMGNPLIAVILGAFLALSVFGGAVAAFAAVDKYRAFRERRLYALHPPYKGK